MADGLNYKLESDPKERPDSEFRAVAGQAEDKSNADKDIPECEVFDIISPSSDNSWIERDVNQVDGTELTGQNTATGCSQGFYFMKGNQVNCEAANQNPVMSENHRSAQADQAHNLSTSSQMPSLPEENSLGHDLPGDDIVQIFRKAVQADHGHKYVAAVSYYKAGLSKFDNYLKEKERMGHIGPSFSSLKRKYEEFLSRCDKIENSLNTPIVRNIVGSNLRVTNRCQSSSRPSTTKDLMVYREMFLTRPQHKLRDVIGLRSLKLKLTEGIILPFKFPSLFSGSRRRIYNYGHFLFGPAGVGKTRLALAIGGEVEDCTVFHAHICDFIAGPDGGERAVKMLFELAVLHQPSLVILDEMELFGKNEDMLYRQIKTELLVQLHAISEESIFVIAISNAPWQLDYSIRKRFTYRLFARQPDGECRYEMLKYFIGQSKDELHDLSDNDLRELAVRTKGFTGADLQVILNTARMNPICEIMQATHFQLVDTIEEGKETKKYIPCTGVTDGAIESTFDNLDLPLMPRCMNMNDMVQALSRPSVSEEELQKFEDYVNTCDYYNPYDEEMKKPNEPESLRDMARAMIQSFLPVSISLEAVQSLELPRSLLLYVLLRD